MNISHNPHHKMVTSFKIKREGVLQRSTVNSQQDLTHHSAAQSTDFAVFEFDEGVNLSPPELLSAALSKKNIVYEYEEDRRVHSQVSTDCSTIPNLLPMIESVQDLTHHSAALLERNIVFEYEEDWRVHPQVATAYSTIPNSLPMVESVQDLTHHSAALPKNNVEYKFAEDKEVQQTSNQIMACESNEDTVEKGSLPKVPVEAMELLQNSDLDDTYLDPHYQPDSDDYSSDDCEPVRKKQNAGRPDLSEKESMALEMAGPKDTRFIKKLKTEDDKVVTSHISSELPNSNSHNIQDPNKSSTCSLPSMKMKSRVWNRQNYCLYCRTKVTNFSRHIVRWHACEKEVMEYLSVMDEDLKLRKKKRQMITDSLRNRGNFIYNQASKESHDDVLPNRRGKEGSVDNRKYLTCRFCLSMFSKKTFYRHRQKCAAGPVDQKDIDSVGLGEIVFGKRPTGLTKPDGIALVLDSKLISTDMRERILSSLNKDELGLIAINDSLILKTASQFFSSRRAVKDEENVRKKLRDGARLLKTCRSKDDSIKELSDLFNAKKFNLVMESVQDLCGFNETRGTVQTIGMPARLSYIIQEGAKILVCEALTKNGITEHQKNKVKTDVDDFLHLFKARWKYIISSNAEKSRKKAVSLKEKLLPDDGDIQTIASKIKELEHDFSAKLRHEVTALNYEELCKATIAHVIILNRRRAGEAARAELECYLRRPPQADLSEDVLSILTEEERKTLRQMTVFTVTGKTTPVPVLLTEQMKSNVDLIVSCRDALGIPRTNPFLFARISTDKPFDGSKIIREIKERYFHLLKKPADLTSRGLRNHFATKSQIVNSEKYTENVCQFLGHTKDVHKQNYRIPLQAVQRGQIGHRLLSMEGSIDQSIPSETFEPLPSVSGLDYHPSTSAQDFPDPDADTEPTMGEASNTQLTRKKNVPVRRRWTEEEKTIVISNLGKYVEIGKEPGMAECSKLIREHRILQTRTWKHVNALIHNYITGKAKLPINYTYLRR